MAIPAVRQIPFTSANFGLTQVKRLPICPEHGLGFVALVLMVSAPIRLANLDHGKDPPCGNCGPWMLAKVMPGQLFKAAESI